jgi:predicted  nucleic acid-binding Zn-ribbon protein
MDRDNFYTVPETAKILDISQTRVRQLLREGSIEGMRNENTWEVSRQSVHTFRDTYEPKGRAKDTETMPQDTREALDEVKALTHRLGKMEGRLELESVARSTLEQSLRREQERADQERQERIQAQQAAQQLREELEQARLPWYKRLFSS